ncbi:NirD/YgiW/YdeI family stress tolerance protein [Janthinobacterium sp. PLB04]|uniref:NirD/YgiW/YdeI family stress tolerance protein n=1 Tax=Janthinobacterium lividum TaxID=29581 RepID=A0AAJ4T3R8_9BURK|nr:MULTISPECIES: NirD/YgiW/YdeI family stress tolerance protein [Janthinobacterium]KAB0325620.1 NirD/YgiW/YdeI family stress tolerance protein [Janthinobacterium lividum]QSX94728.1 NirD/YgiW/YdeI family stress tolerance protein [Janthinobacterium lividum]UGQ34542.1 NirD/YgiW/YdeI family stress tolerance protein [Janthinobacterium sp. PLB04]
MPLHRKLIVSLAAACALLAGGAQAQYVGPTTGPAAPGNVAAILKNPVDDQAVVLRGHLLRKVGNEKYTFSDGTAEIRVDIDDKVFMNRKIDAKTRVEIRGEVEKDFMESPEIDVDVLTLVQ